MLQSGKAEGKKQNKNITALGECDQHMGCECSEIGGCWNGEAGRFVHHLLRVRSQASASRFAARPLRAGPGILGVARRQHGAGADLARAAPPVSKGRRPTSGRLSSQALRALVACHCDSRLFELSG